MIQVTLQAMGAAARASLDQAAAASGAWAEGGQANCCLQLFDALAGSYRRNLTGSQMECHQGANG